MSYARDLATVGHRRGQMSRIDPRASPHAKPEERPRRPGLSEPLTSGLGGRILTQFLSLRRIDSCAVEAGATCRDPARRLRSGDDEVIKAPTATGIAMVFTGTRHFRH
jgi:phosphoribosylaminoimidazolecarboxamide formyltransferase/IMP cyclohydrolase